MLCFILMGATFWNDTIKFPWLNRKVKKSFLYLCWLSSLCVLPNLKLHRTCCFISTGVGWRKPCIFSWKLFLNCCSCNVWLFETPWTAVHQASLSLTISQSLPKLCPLHQWCHPAISSSNILFSFCSFYITCYKFCVLFITLSPQLD